MWTDSQGETKKDIISGMIYKRIFEWWCIWVILKKYENIWMMMHLSENILWERSKSQCGLPPVWGLCNYAVNGEIHLSVYTPCYVFFYPQKSDIHFLPDSEFFINFAKLRTVISRDRESSGPHKSEPVSFIQNFYLCQDLLHPRIFL